jgi:hypothetical protein
MMDEEVRQLFEFRKDHLGWPAPADLIDRVGLHDAVLYLRERKILIEEAERDPLQMGYVPMIWDTVEEQIKDLRKKFPVGVIKIIVWGGNRSSKTRFAANYVNRDCLREGRRWWCCDSTEAMARANQMRLIWEQFPPEWKNLQRDQVTKVRYSVADGFSENMFVCPNRSEVNFKFYSMDVANLPGPELDGIWADELIPLVWVETLIYRLVNRNGILLITFTPELGWNETYGYFYEGAQVLEESDAQLLPKLDEQGRTIAYTKVPRVMQCQDPTARIVFFHTKDNPFGNYPSLKQQLKNKGREEILIRAYGVCTKSHMAAFPMMNRAAHVITNVEFQRALKDNPKAERYHLVDPCSGRNWFMIWVLCPYPDKWIVYREWPSHGHQGGYVQGFGMPGAWAVSGAAADGVAGPAQKSFGFGLQRYMEEILEKEDGEGILARYIDSRYAGAATLDRERVTTLIEQMSEVGMDFLGMTAESRILGVKDGSIDMINSALFYDVETELGKFSPELSRVNVPQLQVLETCPNSIWALEHWTGKDAQRGACKDPIDCIRGLFLTSVNFVSESVYAWSGGGIPR